MDELQALFWAFCVLLSPLPPHSAQTSDKYLSGLSFTGFYWPALPTHPAQTSYKCLSGYFFQLGLYLHLPFHHIQPRWPTSTHLDFFSCWCFANFAPPLPSHSAQTSDKYSSGLSFTGFYWPALPTHPAQMSLQVFVWLFFLLGLYLHLPFHRIQPRWATSTHLDSFFILMLCYLLCCHLIQPRQVQALVWDFFSLDPSILPCVQYPLALICPARLSWCYLSIVIGNVYFFKLES